MFDFLLAGRRFRSVFGFTPKGDSPVSEEEHVVTFRISELQQKHSEADRNEAEARRAVQQATTHGTALAALNELRLAEVKTNEADHAFSRICHLVVRFGFVRALENTPYAYLVENDGDTVTIGARSEA